MSLFSLTVILLIAVPMLIEIFRGMNRGVRRTSATLGVVVLSMVTSSFVAAILANFLSGYARQVISSNIGYSDLTYQFPSIDAMVPAYAAALMTPILFLPVFFLCRLIFSLIMRGILNARLKASGKDLGYDTQNAAWSAEKSKAVGGGLGALCGFLTAIVVLTPFLGTLNLANRTIRIVEKNEYLLDGVSLNEVEFSKLHGYVEEGPVSLVYYLGVEPMYDSLARTSLFGHKLVVSREVDNLDNVMSMLGEVVDTFSDVGSITGDKVKSIENILDELSDSPTFCLLASDFLSGASKAWLNGEDYLGMNKVIPDGLLTPVVDEILKVCAATNIDNVGEDMMTILHVIRIAVENDIAASEDYAAIIEKLNEGHMLMQMCDELRENKRMSYIVDGVWELSMKAVAYLVENYNYDQGQYEALMQRLADSMNTCKSYKYDIRVEKMAQYAVSEIESFLGITIPIDVATIVSEAMDAEIFAPDGTVRPSNIIEFFEFYAR